MHRIKIVSLKLATFFVVTLATNAIAAVNYQYVPAKVLFGIGYGNSHPEEF